MTLYHDSRPIYGPYRNWASVCDRTALDEIALYGDVLSAVADSTATGRLTWAEIDSALGLQARSATVVRPEESGTQRPSSGAGEFAP